MTYLPGLFATENSFQTAGTTVTAHATVHTKGSWVSIVASTPFDVTWLGVTTADDTSASATDTGQLCDIGIGATEVVLIGNVPTGHGALWRRGGGAAWFPVNIPSGTKISARIQAVITVDTCDVQLFMLGSPPWQQPSFQAIDTIGAVTASSAGTDLSSGSITELVASTAEDYKAIGWVCDLGVGGNFGGDSRDVEIFVGAGAVEKSLVDDIAFRSDGAELVEATTPKGFYPVAMNIPSGSRLSAQAVGSRDVGIVVFGFR